MPKRKDNQIWNTPIIFSGIISAAIVISGLHGLWREWWVEFLLIPFSLLACSFGIYEFLMIRVKKIRPVFAILLSVLSFILLVGGVATAYKSTPKNVGESISADILPADKMENKPTAIAMATVSTNQTQAKAVISDDDNPATSDSIYLAGQTVMQFADIYKGQPTELAIEASNQLAKHRPKCSVFLFEKAELYYENDVTHASSAWRQMRPDYAWALFLTDRDGEAIGQLRKLIADIKTAISNPLSPLTTTIITVQENGSANINKTLNDNVNFLMQNCNSKPTSIEYIGPMWNEYSLLCFQISTNKF